MARRRIADTLSEIDHRLEQQGMPLLSENDREQIKIKAKEHVAKKRRDVAEAEALAQAIKEEEREYNVAEQLEYVTIDLAPFVASERFNAAFIAIDGIRYFHGIQYQLPYSVARTVEDIMARGWEHEREIHGERRKNDINRRPIQASMTADQLSRVNTTASLRRSV